MDCPEAAKRLQRAAQEQHKGSQLEDPKRALQKRKTPRGTGASSLARGTTTSFLGFSFPRPLLFSLPRLTPPGSKCPCAPPAGAAVRAAFPDPSPSPHSPPPPAKRGGAGGEEDGGGRQHPRGRGAASRSLRDPQRLRGKTRRRRMSLQSAQYLR